MNKITFVGIESEKVRFLQRLQDVGVAHLILPKEGVEPQDLVRELNRVIEVRKFLERKGEKGKPEEKPDAKEVCEKREQLGQQEAEMQSEIVLLKKQRASTEPWGDFSIADMAEMKDKGLSIQFFRISRRVFETLEFGEGVFCQVVSDRGGETFFVTFSPDPVDLNLMEEKLPSMSLSEIDREISYKRAKLEEVEKEYVALAGHLGVLEKAEAELTDMLAYQRAMLNSKKELEDRLFVVQCWSPIPEDELLQRVGGSFALYHYGEEPEEHDRMPVKMENPPAFESGEDLVKIYSYPSHHDFDPSPFVLYCFAVFFGMIVGDFGYGLVLLGLTVWLRKKVTSQSPLATRMFRLMYLLTGSVLVWGVLGGGFFGIEFEPEHPIRRFSILDYGSQEGQRDIMILSIIIGMVHICLSLAIKAYKDREYSGIGWIVAIWSAYFLLNSKMAHGQENMPATYGLIVGLAGVFLFSSKSRNPLLRIAEGLQGLLGVVQIFSDVLSYLRLFALGVATVYIAQTFNILAGSVSGGLPVIGFVFAGIILFIGHTLNIGLAIMGGVIHGLRLNFLEWYRWCFEGDGLEYKPFQRVSE